jgi:hypothetical protein
VQKKPIEGGTSWRIENKKAEMTIEVYNDDHPKEDGAKIPKDGIYIEGLYIHQENSNLKYLSRSEFRELVEKILSCMDETGRQKIYTQADRSQVARVLESLGGTLDTVQPSGEHIAPWYVIDRAGIESAHRKLQGK